MTLIHYLVVLGFLAVGLLAVGAITVFTSAGFAFLEVAFFDGDSPMELFYLRMHQVPSLLLLALIPVLIKSVLKSRRIEQRQGSDTNR